MKRQVFLLAIFIFSCWALVFAHNKESRSVESESEIKLEFFQINKEFRPTKGSCYMVIESLRESQENDSIAIEVFKEEYKFTNMRYSQREWLLSKSYTEIIHFFSLEKNKKFYCQWKKFLDPGPVLLIE